MSNWIVTYYDQSWLVLKCDTGEEAIEAWMNATDRADFQADKIEVKEDRAEQEVWKLGDESFDAVEVPHAFEASTDFSDVCRLCGESEARHEPD